MLLKSVARRIWRLSGGVRRRMIEKADRHLIAQFEPWLARIDRAHAQNQLLVRDVEWLGDTILRELARLQSHVEGLDHRLQASGSEPADAADLTRPKVELPEAAPRRHAA